MRGKLNNLQEQLKSSDKSQKHIPGNLWRAFRSKPTTQFNEQSKSENDSENPANPRSKPSDLDWQREYWTQPQSKPRDSDWEISRKQRFRLRYSGWDWAKIERESRAIDVDGENRINSLKQLRFWWGEWPRADESAVSKK